MESRVEQLKAECDQICEVINRWTLAMAKAVNEQGVDPRELIEAADGLKNMAASADEWVRTRIQEGDAGALRRHG
jgi:hypothetical protein